MMVFLNCYGAYFRLGLCQYKYVLQCILDGKTFILDDIGERLNFCPVCTEIVNIGVMTQDQARENLRLLFCRCPVSDCRQRFWTKPDSGSSEPKPISCSRPTQEKSSGGEITQPPGCG